MMNDKKVRRWIVVILVLCMLTALIGCNGEPVEDSNLNFLSTNGYSVYTVVYSEMTATEELVSAAEKLRDILEVILDCEVGLRDDHVKEGMEYAYEILVGDTNRSACQNALSKLEEDEYIVCVDGHKIVLTGTDNRATLKAVEHFMEDVLECENMETAQINLQLSISPTYQYTGKRVASTEENLKETHTVPCSPYLPTELLLVDLPENRDDAMTLATLQGLAAAKSGEQILMRAGNWELYYEQLTASAPEGYGVTVYETNAQGELWTTELLLSYYASQLDGYILCNGDLSHESAGVSISLAHQLNAVVVTPANESMAKAAGLTCVLDATKATMEWLMSSTYFEQINRSVAVEQSAMMAPALIDYAVMTGCLFYFYDGTDDYMHAQYFRYLDDGAAVLGGNRVLGKYQTLSSLSSINLSLIPAENVYNLSTLSGFSREGKLNLWQDTKESAEINASDTESGERHTICFLMSDGDDLEWMLNDFISERWYGSEVRGSLAMNWGVCATLNDLANPVFDYLSETQSEQDEFVLQFSGIGDTFPSKWNLAALGEMASQLGNVMKSTGIRYLEILDDDAFDPTLLTVFAHQEAIEGIFYIDYDNHAGKKGTIIWAEDTPLVAARYCLWSELYDGSLEYVAESINSAPTDPTLESSYSVVIVHAGSGLGNDGTLISGGDTMDAVAALMGMLDEDVDVVTASEFMNRIKANLQSE